MWCETKDIEHLTTFDILPILDVPVLPVEQVAIYCAEEGVISLIYLDAPIVFWIQRFY